MRKIHCPGCSRLLDEDIQVCPFCDKNLSVDTTEDVEGYSSSEWLSVAAEERGEHLRPLLIRLAVLVGFTALIWLFNGFKMESLPFALLIGFLIGSTYVLIEPAIGIGSSFKAIKITKRNNEEIAREQVNFGWVGALIAIAIVYGVCYYLSTLMNKLPSYVIADEIAITLVLLLIPLYRNLKNIQGIVKWTAVISSAKKQRNSGVDSATAAVFTNHETKSARFNKWVIAIVAIGFAVLVITQTIQVKIVSGTAPSSYDPVAMYELQKENGKMSDRLLLAIDPSQLGEPTEAKFFRYNTMCDIDYQPISVSVDGVSYEAQVKVSGEYELSSGWHGELIISEYTAIDVDIRNRSFEGEAEWLNDNEEWQTCFVRLTVLQASSESEDITGKVTVYAPDKQTVLFEDTISGSVILPQGESGAAEFSVAFDNKSTNSFFWQEEHVHLTLHAGSFELVAYGDIEGELFSMT